MSQYFYSFVSTYENVVKSNKGHDRGDWFDWKTAKRNKDGILMRKIVTDYKSRTWNFKAWRVSFKDSSGSDPNRSRAIFREFLEVPNFLSNLRCGGLHKCHILTGKTATFKYVVMWLKSICCLILTYLELL